MLLNFEQIQIIQQYVAENGLYTLEVQQDVIDHLCCMVEEKMEEGFDFENAFTEAQQYFPASELQAIQEDTIYYLTIKKNVIMIKTIFISGYLSVMFYVIGVFFAKYGFVILGTSTEIIGFGIILSSVTTFCFVFLPALFLFGYKKFMERVKA